MERSRVVLGGMVRAYTFRLRRSVVPTGSDPRFPFHSPESDFPYCAVKDFLEMFLSLFERVRSGNFLHTSTLVSSLDGWSQATLKLSSKAAFDELAGATCAWNTYSLKNG